MLDMTALCMQTVSDHIGLGHEEADAAVGVYMAYSLEALVQREQAILNTASPQQSQKYIYKKTRYTPNLIITKLY